MSLANTEKFPKLKVITNVYVENGEEYVYSKECNKEFPFNSIIMKVKVELKDNGNFTRDAKDKSTLEEFIESVSKPRKKTSVCKQKKSDSIINQDGSVIFEVESTRTDDGKRKSSSKKKTRLSLPLDTNTGNHCLSAYY